MIDSFDIGKTVYFCVLAYLVMELFLNGLSIGVNAQDREPNFWLYSYFCRPLMWFYFLKNWRHHKSQLFLNYALSASVLFMVILGNKLHYLPVRERAANIKSDRGGVQLNSIKLGAVSREEEEKFSKNLTVAFEGGPVFKVDRGDPQANKALIEASKKGDFEGARIALENGARIDCVSDEDYTALMEAVQYGYFELAEFLIRKGANTVYKAPDGQSALSLARMNFRKDIEKLLENQT